MHDQRLVLCAAHIMQAAFVFVDVFIAKTRSFIDFQRILDYTHLIATHSVGDVNSRRNHGDAVLFHHRGAKRG